MAKNKTHTGAIILGVFVALLLLGGGGFLIYKFAVPSQSILDIPQYCYSSEPFNTVGSYTCPADSAGCSVTVKLKCNTQTGENPVVLARVKDFNYGSNGHWIVYMDDYGQLKSYTEQSTVSGSPLVRQSDVLDLPYNWKGYFSTKAFGGTYETVLIIPNPKYFTADSIPSDTNQWRNYVYYRAGGVGNTNPLPLYDCQNQEICSGTTEAFSCQQSSTGDLILTIKDSKPQAWEKTNSGTLPAGKRINWVGEITGDASYRQESECRENKVNPSDPNSYYECILVDGCGEYKTSLSYCDDGEVYLEAEQRCSAPYTATLTTTQQSYAQTDAIKGALQLKDTAQISGIDVYFQLYDVAGNQIIEKKVTTASNGKAEFSIGAQAVGTYEIKAKIMHPLKTSYSNTVRVSVVQPMGMVLYPKNIRQNTGQVEITAIIIDEAGDPKTDITDFDFSGTGCGTKDYSAQTTWAFKTTSARGAEYTIISNVDQACSQFIFKVVSIDATGYRSNPVTQTVTVEKSTVVIEPVNENDLHNKDEGVYTFKFLVLNEQRQPITPQSLHVVVQEKGGCVSGEFCTAEGSQFFGKNIPEVSVTSTGTGQYQFSHDFEDGLNYIYISASADGLSDTTYDTSLHFWQVDDEIGGGGDDDDGGDDGGLPIGLIVTSGIVLVGLVIFFVIVFRRKK